MGVAGGISVVLAVVVIVAYRNYKYEQELDSLLWKVDPKDLKVSSPVDTVVMWLTKLWAFQIDEATPSHNPRLPRSRWRYSTVPSNYRFPVLLNACEDISIS